MESDSMETVKLEISIWIEEQNVDLKADMVKVESNFSHPSRESAIQSWSPDKVQSKMWKPLNRPFHTEKQWRFHRRDSRKSKWDSARSLSIRACLAWFSANVTIVINAPSTTSTRSRHINEWKFWINSKTQQQRCTNTFADQSNRNYVAIKMLWNLTG